jgi:translation elongation factor EF-1alpha
VVARFHISSFPLATRALSNKPLKLTIEQLAQPIRGVGQASPGWVAHGKLNAGRSLAANR